MNLLTPDQRASLPDSPHRYNHTPHAKPCFFCCAYQYSVHSNFLACFLSYCTPNSVLSFPSCDWVRSHHLQTLEGILLALVFSSLSLLLVTWSLFKGATSQTLDRVLPTPINFQVTTGVGLRGPVNSPPQVSSPVTISPPSLPAVKQEIFHLLNPQTTKRTFMIRSHQTIREVVVPSI